MRLKYYLECKTSSLFKILVKELKDFKFEVMEDGDNYIYVDNGSPLLLVAHMDTITRNVNFKLKIERNIITAENSVLGADDRAGCYAIMELLNRCKAHNIPYPSVLFTNYEESGMQGVTTFCKSNLFNTEVKLMVEIDRMGCNEYVFYSKDLPDEVRDYVESFGFHEEYGIISDVEELTSVYKIPHVNVSAGYYNQHSIRERLHVDELELTINRVFEMIKFPFLETCIVEDGKKYYNDYSDYSDWYCSSYEQTYQTSYYVYDRMSDAILPDKFEVDDFQVQQLQLLTV